MHESIARMDHPNLVVVHYNPYAGGKFFINCLAHHDQVLPGLCVAAPVHTYDHWIFEPLSAAEKTQRKIERINSTIPEQSRMHFWAQHELGCQQFWGWGFGKLWSQPVQANHYSLSLLKQHQCFIVNHGMNRKNHHMIKKIWPQARHIVLYNESQFQQRAVQLKNHDPDFGHLKTEQLPRDLAAFYFDVDTNQFDKQAIINQTELCLAWLGLDTQLHSNIHHYIDRYFAIHQ
jgi:hypothetical protein